MNIKTENEFIEAIRNSGVKNSTIIGFTSHTKTNAFKQRRR